MTAEVSDTPEVDKLRAIVSRLDNLLKDPHPGLMTWRKFMDNACLDMSRWLAKHKYLS
ncbi:hypothetical protein LCGC14_2260420 [marine sediment metagenome]|uniref:Uncharacterized protein n=1 Tax=marine sediment metagenome TaxID=412755 RepID=A0A0F9CZV7_9ZZZZ